MNGLKNGVFTIADTTMDYIRFGRGSRQLILLPGLSDGLTTVKGKALPMKMMYGRYMKGFTVWSFSRRNRMPEGFSIADMADDLALLMDQLSIEKADLIGISQGGMVAQQLSIRHPEKVNKLVLGVSTAAADDTLKTVVNQWIEYAKNGDYKSLFVDTTEKSYTQSMLKKYRLLYPILSKIGKPKDFSRFLVAAEACIHHDTRQQLPNLKVPTLILGGGMDRIVGEKASAELAALIPGSRHIFYPELGHAAYEEAKDFFPKTMEFLNEK